MSVWMSNLSVWQPNHNDGGNQVPAWAAKCSDAADRACQWVGVDQDAIISELSMNEQEQVLMAAATLGGNLLNPHLSDAVMMRGCHQLVGSLRQYFPSAIGSEAVDA